MANDHALGRSDEAQARGDAGVTLTEDEAALLDDNADDWYGLWEVEWWFNGVCPAWPHQRRAEMLGGLVRRGLIEVFFGRLGRESPPLSADAAVKVLAEPEHWLPRTAQDEAVYHVSTSEAGVRALAGS